MLIFLLEHSISVRCAFYLCILFEMKAGIAVTCFLYLHFQFYDYWLFFLGFQISSSLYKQHRNIISSSGKKNNKDLILNQSYFNIQGK